MLYKHNDIKCVKNHQIDKLKRFAFVKMATMSGVGNLLFLLLLLRVWKYIFNILQRKRSEGIAPVSHMQIMDFCFFIRTQRKRIHYDMKWNQASGENMIARGLYMVHDPPRLQFFHCFPVHLLFCFTCNRNIV